MSAEDFAKLKELVAAIEHYFTTWNNEGKKPGWCARLDNARDRVLIAIAKAKEVAA